MGTHATDVFAMRKERMKRAPKTAALRRKLFPITIPERVMQSTPLVLKPEDFGRLMIGDYQRSEMKDSVGRYRDAIRRGSMPPPIDVCVRLWDQKDKARKEMLWIADGQQRMWALFDLGLPMHCNVHWVETVDEEEDLFIVLNDRARLGASHVFYAHNGPTAEMIKALVDDKEHSLFGRVVTGKYSGSRNKLEPGVVVTSLCIALGINRGGILRSLEGCDNAIKNGSKDKALSYLADLGAGTAGKANQDIVHSFATVWQKKGPLAKKALGRIKKLKLANVSGSTPADRRAAMERRILNVLS